MTSKSPEPVSLPDTMIEPLHEDGVDSDAHCLEKRVYYKVISGMSSILLFAHVLNRNFRIAHFNIYSYLSRMAESVYGRMGNECLTVIHFIGLTLPSRDLICNVSLTE